MKVPLTLNFEEIFIADMHIYLADMDGIWRLCLVKDFSELINCLLNILANQINIVLIKILAIEGKPKLCPLP